MTSSTSQAYTFSFRFASEYTRWREVPIPVSSWFKDVESIERPRWPNPIVFIDFYDYRYRTRDMSWEQRGEMMDRVMRLVAEGKERELKPYRDFVTRVQWNAGPRPPIPTHVRRKVMQRDGRRCVWCGSTDRLHLDHVKPYSRGGVETVSNLRVLCQSCNLRRGPGRGVRRAR